MPKLTSRGGVGVVKRRRGELKKDKRTMRENRRKGKNKRTNIRTRQAKWLYIHNYTTFSLKLALSICHKTLMVLVNMCAGNLFLKKGNNPTIPLKMFYCN